MNKNLLHGEIESLLKRLQRINSYIERAEEVLFSVDEVTVERPRQVLLEEYGLARKAQMESMEFVRKVLSQPVLRDENEIDEETFEIARRLKTCDGEELKKIKQHLSVVK